ncbi:MAG: hypothetical protein ACRC8J_03040 [Phocaeicola sp.]
MKKTLLFASIAFAAITFTACGGKTKNTNADTTHVTVEMADSVKADLVKIWDEIQTGSNLVMATVKELPAEAKKLEPTFFAPKSLADKAQTQQQKYALLGLYLTDATFEKTVYSRTDAARSAVISKIASEVNAPFLSKINWEEADASKSEEVLKQNSKDIAAAFGEALENNNADKFGVLAIYAIIESSLNTEGLYEIRNGHPADEIQIAEDARTMSELRNHLLDFITTLTPHYPSLEVFAPLVKKLQAVRDAEIKGDDNELFGAIIEYFIFTKEMRVRLVTELS